MPKWQFHVHLPPLYAYIMSAGGADMGLLSGPSQSETAVELDLASYVQHPSRPASALAESIDASDDAKQQYFTRLAELYQQRTPTYRGASTDTSSRFIWTYRNTGCDVMSVVTTTMPVRNGAMKDVKIFNKEMRRIKPSKKDTKTSPFEQGQVTNKQPQTRIASKY